MAPKVSFHDPHLKFTSGEDDWFLSCNKYSFLFSGIAWLTRVSSPVKTPCTNYSSRLAKHVKYGTDPKDELRDRLYTSLSQSSLYSTRLSLTKQRNVYLSRDVRRLKAPILSYKCICTLSCVEDVVVRPGLCLSSTCVLPLSTALQHIRTFFLHFTCVLDTNWRWISIGERPFMYKNRIKLHTSISTSFPVGLTVHRNCTRCYLVVVWWQTTNRCSLHGESRCRMMLIHVRHGAPSYF